jgi:hypothetical protein
LGKLSATSAKGTALWNVAAWYGTHREVQTQNFASVQIPSYQSDHPKSTNKFGPQSQNLASIIRGFKIGVTKFAKTKTNGFGWQPRFHDHIIRNEESYQRIKNYIRTNPQNWKSDKFSK